MTGALAFQSLFADGLRDYLATKRALGRRYRTEAYAVRLLDRFLVAQGVADAAQLTPALLEAFLASRPRTTPRSFNHLLGVVRQCLDWLVAQGRLAGSPLRARPHPVTAQRVPYLFGAAQARQLLAAAAALPDNARAPQRGPTYRTILALLYGLGLRVGEACRLQRGDVELDRGLLVIRESKFGKSRLVPFGPRMAALLQAHLARRDPAGPLDPHAPLFTFDGRRAISPMTVSQTFFRLTRQLGLVGPPGTAPPRCHDLRHSFAVGTLLRWYRAGEDPGAKLYPLATFLGHVDPASTAVYLTITPDLFGEAARRFAAFAGPVLAEEAP